MIRLVLALICLCSSALAEPSLRPHSVTRWQLDTPWFGGWSGIEITEGGRTMIVVGDRGHLVEAVLQRAQGQIAAIGVRSVKGLSRASGAPLRQEDRDAEGLAIGVDGAAFLSFEHRHRIMKLDVATGRTSGRIDLPFAGTLGGNAGVEALAIGPDGTLYALAENAPPGGQPFPLYAYRNGAWRIAAQIPQRGPFVPVGADVDPYGRLWLLERTVTPLGFRSRIRLFVLDPAAAREYTLMTSIPARYDNLEGISVWQDRLGRLRLTMISDDNFLMLQRTHIVEYLVEE